MTVSKTAGGNTEIVIEKNKDTELDMDDLNKITGDFDDAETDSDIESADDDQPDGDDGSGGAKISQDVHDEEMRFKEQKIASLDEKVRTLRSKLESLQKQMADELSERNQKIGELQTKLEMEREQFLTANQSLEYKMSKKESDGSKLKEELDDLRRDHRKQIKSLKKEIEALTQQVRTGSGVMMPWLDFNVVALTRKRTDFRVTTPKGSWLVSLF